MKTKMPPGLTCNRLAACSAIPSQRPTQHGFHPRTNRLAAPEERQIASSCAISRDDFDYAELADKGGLQKVWGLFGKELDTLMDEMNMELVA